MFKKYRRRWQLSKAKPGDGSRLQRFRLWHLLSRSLFALELPDESGRPQPSTRSTSTTSGTARRPSAPPRSTATASRCSRPTCR